MKLTEIRKLKLGQILLYSGKRVFYLGPVVSDIVTLPYAYLYNTETNEPLALSYLDTELTFTPETISETETKFLLTKLSLVNDFKIAKDDIHFYVVKIKPNRTYIISLYPLARLVQNYAGIKLPDDIRLPANMYLQPKIRIKFTETKICFYNYWSDATLYTVIKKKPENPFDYAMLKIEKDGLILDET